MKKLVFGVCVAAFSSSPAFADWTPRQATIIRAANAVVEAEPWAYTSMCSVLDGKRRFDASQLRLKEMHPAMTKELGDYPVYEIFVLRAPMYASSARPAERCKAPKRYPVEREQAMQRYELTIESLATVLRQPAN